MRDAAARENHDAWARRNPQAAAEQAALQAQALAIEEAYGHKAGGTAQTFAHHEGRAGGALARLYRSQAIDAEQLAAATDIAQIAERIASAVTVRTASLEARVDATRMGGEAFFERLNAVRREVAYTSWRAEVAKLGPVGVVLDCVIGDTIGVTIVARKHGMHVRRVKRMLIAALDLWPVHLAQAFRRVDELHVAIAHAMVS